MEIDSGSVESAERIPQHLWPVSIVFSKIVTEYYDVLHSSSMPIFRDSVINVVLSVWWKRGCRRQQASTSMFSLFEHTTVHSTFVHKQTAECLPVMSCGMFDNVSYIYKKVHKMQVEESYRGPGHLGAKVRRAFCSPFRRPSIIMPRLSQGILSQQKLDKHFCRVFCL